MLDVMRNIGTMNVSVALIAQRIERCPPEAEAQVRVLVGVLK